MMKICAECKWYEIPDDEAKHSSGHELTKHKCNHELSKHDRCMITGEWERNGAYSMRTVGDCGKEGRLWESKYPKPEK